MSGYGGFKGFQARQKVAAYQKQIESNRQTIAENATRPSPDASTAAAEQAESQQLAFDENPALRASQAGARTDMSFFDHGLGAIGGVTDTVTGVISGENGIEATMQGAGSMILSRLGGGAAGAACLDSPLVEIASLCAGAGSAIGGFAGHLGGTVLYDVGSGLVDTGGTVVNAIGRALP